MKPLLYKIAYKILKIYWFIFRPKTQGVKCLIIKNNGDILLIKNSYGNKSWNLPGGGIKKNETFVEAVKREVKEELRIDITPYYIGKFTQDLEYKKDTVHCFFTHTEYLYIDSGSEIKDFKFFDKNNLPKKCSQSVHKVLDMYYKLSIKY